MTRTRAWTMNGAGVLALGLCGAPLALAVPGQADAQARRFADVDGLLAAVQEADRGVTTLRGTIRHTDVNTLANDMQSRDGELFLETEWQDAEAGEGAPPVRKFAVRFDSLIADGTMREERRWFVYDGRWVIEVVPVDRTFNKWEVTPPGQRLDPFEDPGDMPFWLPLGREADRIRRIAEPEMLAPEDGLGGDEVLSGLIPFLREEGPTVQLHLVPREGTTFAEKWDDVRIWFRRTDLMPVLYVATDPSGDLRISQLYEVRANVALDPTTFNTTTPAADSGWDVTETRYRGDASE